MSRVIDDLRATDVRAGAARTSQAGDGAHVAPAARHALDALVKQACSHDLFAVIRRLERLDGRMPRLSAPVSFAFPASDVASIEPPAGPDDRWTVRSPLMPLGGAHGPLPLVTSEQLIAAIRRGDGSVQDFLDLFQDRFLALLYRARQRHHPALAGAPDGPSRQERLLDALGGLGRADGARDPSGHGLWLRHAGLLGSAPRSLAGLERLLADRFGLAVRGRSFQGGWLPLSDDTARPLGACRLGRDSVLGRRAWDPAAGIGLTIGPVPLSRLEALLPGGEAHAQLGWIASRHASRDLSVGVTLSVAPTPPRALPALGRSRLGRDAWLQPRTGPDGLGRLAAVRLPDATTTDA